MVEYGKGQEKQQHMAWSPFSSTFEFKTPSVLWLVNVEIASDSINVTKPNIRSIFDIHQPNQSYANPMALHHKPSPIYHLKEFV